MLLSYSQRVLEVLSVWGSEKQWWPYPTEDLAKGKRYYQLLFQGAHTEGSSCHGRWKWEPRGVTEGHHRTGFARGDFFPVALFWGEFFWRDKEVNPHCYHHMSKKRIFKLHVSLFQHRDSAYSFSVLSVDSGKECYINIRWWVVKIALVTLLKSTELQLTVLLFSIWGTIGRLEFEGLILNIAGTCERILFLTLSPETKRKSSRLPSFLSSSKRYKKIK